MRFASYRSAGSKFLSPGLKSDILRGNSLTRGQPPPTSSHIYTHSVLWYHTINFTILQEFFIKKSKNFKSEIVVAIDTVYMYTLSVLSSACEFSNVIFNTILLNNIIRISIYGGKIMKNFISVLSRLLCLCLISQSVR